MIVDIVEKDLTVEWIIENLPSLIAEHAIERKNILKMQDYFLGKHDILNRTMTTDYVANNKLVNNFPKYITTVAVGYFMGNPISYQTTSDDTGTDELEEFKQILKKGDIESVDIDLSTNCSIAGVGYEFINVYTDFDGVLIPKSYSLYPERTFVVYDNSIEQQPLFGVYYLLSKKLGSRAIAGKVTVATKDKIITLEHNGDVYVEVDNHEHYFGVVPIIEYKNNVNKHGDFQDVISLIDAYNLLQSDRVNDKEQLIDAILKLKGVNLEDKSVVDNIRENRILSLPEDGDAEWLTKQLNEQDTDILRSTLESDIHKFSLTPNITDEQFSGNASGVAMQYKLFGFEQLIKTKERFFQESLRMRIIAYLSLLRTKNVIQSLTPDTIDFVFNRNMPTNNIEIAQMVSQLHNILSDETLISQVPFVKDTSVELKRISKENKERDKRLSDSYGFPDVGVDVNEQDNEEDNSDEVGNRE